MEAATITSPGLVIPDYELSILLPSPATDNGNSHAPTATADAQSTGNPYRDAALGHAAHGMKVIPVERERKKPHVKGWQAGGATDKPALITKYWKAWPDANVGISCGPSGVLVLEVDPRRGGIETIAKLRAEHGSDFVETVTVISGSADGAGRHYYYAMRNTRFRTNFDRLGPGIEVKAIGGQVVAPGSLHASGNTYQWAPGHSPDECAMRDVPAWMAALLQPADADHQTNTRTVKAPRPVGEGGGGVRQVEDFTTCLIPTFAGCVTLPKLVSATDGMLRSLDKQDAFVLAVAHHLLGIPESVGIGETFRCVLPGHEETKPSASLFRTNDGTVMYTDWHNVGEAGKRLQLTLTEVFRAQRTRRVAKIERAPEHATWKLRMCMAIGNLAPAPVAMRPLPDDARDTLRRVYEGIRLLFQCKWRYERSPRRRSPTASRATGAVSR